MPPFLASDCPLLLGFPQTKVSMNMEFDIPIEATSLKTIGIDIRLCRDRDYQTKYRYVQKKNAE